MSCAAIMTRAPATLRDNESLGEAVEKLLGQHHRALPVVDADGRYVGMFGIDDLSGIVMPRVALAGNLLANLRFIGDDPGDPRRKFQALKDRRVSDFANRNATTLAPEDSQIEAIRRFCRNPCALPVVEKASGKVLGILSYADALRALIEPVEA